MVKIPRPPRSTWLKAKIVNDGDVITILAEPVMENPFQSKYGTSRLILPCVCLERTNELYKWGINPTTWSTLYEAYGDEGKDWIGKQVKVSKRLHTIDNRKVYALYGQPHGEAQGILNNVFNRSQQVKKEK